MSPHLPIVALISLLFSGATMGPMRASDDSELLVKSNGGYYLFHHLCDDESNLPMLLAVKHAPPEISTYTDRISKTADDSLAALERIQQADPSIRFDRNPLPTIEQDVRASIKGDKQHQLLFGTTDSEFVRALLVSQIEACTYAIHLSKVLAEQEATSGRVKTLQRLSAEWLDRRNEAYRLLRNY